ncbi:MAG: RagB/SusD family nutrient uptake outer membrane protein, partial [Sphingobacterium sp.]
MKINIKSKYTLIFSAAVLLMSSSCQKEFLDQVPDDRLTLEEVFNRRKLSEEWLAGTYNFIRDEAH